MSFSADRVVVPVDFSGESAAAIQAAITLAGDASHLHVVYVLQPLDSISPGVLLGDVTDDSRKTAATISLKKLTASCGASDAEDVILVGSPGLEIAEYAARINADLIVIPSHGFHGMKRFLLGSTAERVIRHANCSVLVLRRSDAE
jgi:nucleotide-binding universal stress UspA family protein